MPRPLNAGRKPGSKNKKTLLRVKDFLVESEISPIAEIMKLLPELESIDRAKMWLALMPYCEPKLTEAEAAPRLSPEEIFEELRHCLRDVTDEKLIAVAQKEEKENA